MLISLLFALFSQTFLYFYSLLASDMSYRFLTQFFRISVKFPFSMSVLVTLANGSRRSLRLPTKNLILGRWANRQTNKPMDGQLTFISQTTTGCLQWSKVYMYRQTKYSFINKINEAVLEIDLKKQLTDAMLFETQLF